MIGALWQCEECKKDSSSVGSKSDSEDASLMNIPKTIQIQIAEDNKLFKARFNSLEQSMTKIQDSLALVMTRLAAVEDENVKLREECDGLRKENAAMHIRLQNAEWSVADLEQYSRMDNIEVCGVLQTRDRTSWSQWQGSLEYHMTSGVYLLPTAFQCPEINVFNPSIVVRFALRSERAEWLDAAKKEEYTDDGPAYLIQSTTSLC
ncbi:hypothetical protein J6590_064751 [Homalodisca vitripennis]|nr:hypothetical protein J6590_064751 [Homalodisca vitripennis]